VTAENLPAFDWAHMDRSTKTTNISTLCSTSKKAYFKKQWPIERLKCELLCCMCHKTETDEENKIMSQSLENRRGNKGELPGLVEFLNMDESNIKLIINPI
jgi:hypothetical protein